MSPRERAIEKKFTHNNFEAELFELMERCMGYDPVLEPPASVMDTSNVTSGRQDAPATPASAAASPHTSPSMDAPEENSTFDRTPTNGGVPKKARRRTHMLDVGLQEATKDMTKVMEEAEHGRRARHGDSLQVAKPVRQRYGWHLQCTIQDSGQNIDLTSRLREKCSAVIGPTFLMSINLSFCN
ncbi:hypothetical protein GOP47_0003593 [Adiantum capillus-veneris]|uniref:Uncharacterized protein n=1 Tax=Adiantum capillus-veneris TaxID=13818 RepID=A0A9D4ZPJ3_ADICA|nr:hypothetical protein GOP47_0003593 [Adiantum capillus-veneris]